MKYEQHRKTHTSANQTYWFHSQTLPSYKVPTTQIQPSNFLHIEEKQNQDWEILQKNTKGFTFDKSKRPEFFNLKPNQPPCNYFLRQLNLQPTPVKKQESFFFKKYPRFGQQPQKETKKRIIFSQSKKEEKKHRTFSKAQIIRFADNAAYKAEKTPGPGEYYTRISRRCKSLGNFTKNNRKPSSTKQNDKSRGIGPQTYLISRSLSSFCSTKLKKPCQQNDQKMKEKLLLVNRQKEKDVIAASRNYLKIQQWCKYNKDKKPMPNRFNICSKPQLKIYP